MKPSLADQLTPAWPELLLMKKPEVVNINQEMKPLDSFPSDQIFFHLVPTPNASLDIFPFLVCRFPLSFQPGRSDHPFDPDLVSVIALTPSRLL